MGTSWDLQTELIEVLSVDETMVGHLGETFSPHILGYVTFQLACKIVCILLEIQSSVRTPKREGCGSHCEDCHY